MSRAPAHLRAVADELRAKARALALDLEGVPDRVGPATWEGPAAEAARTRTASLTRAAEQVAEGLRRAATRLDAEADAVEARERAEAEARAQQAALAAAERDRQRLLEAEAARAGAPLLAPPVGSR